MKVLYVIKSTRWISRILLILWVFFSLAGAGFDPTQYIYTFPVLAIIFVVPATIIEYKKNPIIGELKDKAKIKKIERDISTQEQKKQNALRIQELQREQQLKQAEAQSELEKLQIAQNIPNFAPQNLDAVTDKPAVTEKTPVLEYTEPSSSKADVPQKVKPKKDKPFLSHRIFGTIFIIFSSIFILSAILGMTFKPQNDLWILLIAGIVIFIFGIFLVNGVMTRAELSKRKKGVFLSDEQIEKLKNKIELPVVNTPVFLHSNEFAVYYSQAIRQETKHRVVARTSSYGGGTVRIAKGLSIHTGGSTSRPIYGDVSTQYPGEFVITNERIIFLSDQKAFEITHNNITAATVYKDGFVFQNKNASYVLMLPHPDLAVIAFDGVRIGDIPIAGSCDIDSDDCNDYFNNDSRDSYEEQYCPTSVSLVDGMEGHDFEYFCAELLKKNGFFDVSVTKGSGDQGVDVLASKDGIRYAIQCKNYASALSNTPIQEVHAGKAFYNCHVGVVMTNSTFTPKAKELANATGVLTWDRTELQKMMDYANIGVEKSIPTVSFDDFDEVVDEDEVFSEIQELIDTYSSDLDTAGDAFDRFAEVVEEAEYRKVPMDRELIALGKNVKKMGCNLHYTTKQMQTKFMMIFASLKKQGFDGWPDEEDAIDAIKRLFVLQKQVFGSLVSMKGNIQNMDNNYGVNQSIFISAKQQAMQDIEQGISLTRQATANFENIITEYERLKSI